MICITMEKLRSVRRQDENDHGVAKAHMEVVMTAHEEDAAASFLTAWQQAARDRGADLADIPCFVEKAGRSAREREDKLVADLRAELDVYPERLTGPGATSYPPPSEPETDSIEPGG